MNVSLFVTGSNSTLLSGELATLLTGRTVEFEILPFSFAELKEFLEINNKPFTEDLFYDYLKWGGFPLRFDYTDETAIRRYLENFPLITSAPIMSVKTHDFFLKKILHLTCRNGIINNTLLRIVACIFPAMKKYFFKD